MQGEEVDAVAALNDFEGQPEGEVRFTDPGRSEKQDVGPLVQKAPRARGGHGGRPYTMTPAKLRRAQAAMAKRDTKVGDLCKELGVTRQTLYRFVDPNGDLRADGAELLKRKGQHLSP